ncbi:hypothetical protein QQ045_008968 [Rhodiola kirilowii]
MALALSFLIMASVADCRLFNSPIGSAPAALACAQVYGAEQNDTCISVGQKFKLNENAFLSINPNINCNKIFVGQWLCVDKA